MGIPLEPAQNKSMVLFNLTICTVKYIVISQLYILLVFYACLVTDTLHFPTWTNLLVLFHSK